MGVSKWIQYQNEMCIHKRQGSEHSMVDLTREDVNLVGIQVKTLTTLAGVFHK